MDIEPRRASGELEEVISRYQSMVYGLALARTGSSTDADDVFQEVFLAYYRSGKTFRDEEHRKAWLLRTALNLSRRVTASTYRRKTVPLEEAAQAAAPIFEREDENALWSALRALPEDYRLPLYLFYFQELSTQDIARALSIRPGAARMRLTRGREQLRELLKGDFFDET